MTGKGFLDQFIKGGLVNAFGQTGGLTGLGPKVSYDATKGFVGSNPIVGGWAGQEVQGRGGNPFVGGLAGSFGGDQSESKSPFRGLVGGLFG